METQLYDTYSQVVAIFQENGYRILGESNGLSWVMMSKVNPVRKTVSIMYWDTSSKEARKIQGINDYMLLDILEEMKT